MLPDKVAFHYKSLIFDELPDPLKDRIAIAGGCIRDIIMGEKVKDIDVFCQDKEAEDSIMKFLAENGTEGVINDQLANYTYKDRWIQVIRNKYYNMETTELIDSFDFTLCMAMITSKGLKVGQFFYESLATKHIRVNRLDYPLSSLERMQKYIKKGYTACNGTLLELSKALKSVDFENNAQNTLLFYPDGTARFLGVD